MYNVFSEITQANKHFQTVPIIAIDINNEQLYALIQSAEQGEIMDDLDNDK